MIILQLAGVAVFPLLVILAALRDVTSFTIPNWISISVAAVFLPAALMAGLPLPLIGLSLALGFGGLLLGMVMFALGWIGGGDAKLMAACALWIGWAGVGPFLLFTAVAGGALAIALLLVRKGFFWMPVAMPAWAQRLATHGENVPYGVAIAIGALAVFPTSPVAAAIGHALR